MGGVPGAGAPAAGHAGAKPFGSGDPGTFTGLPAGGGGGADALSPTPAPVPPVAADDEEAFCVYQAGGV
ncbi:hypothetical protein [Streptomyces sp. NPDC007917]|uniref:hypothetical protein n=1 Tax=Streptomyces sp. NPDC007917 TaxID=3364793 RepID=UPI0036E30783